VGRPERVDPAHEHVLRGDPRAERDRREDRHLGGRVGSGHVLGGIGLGVPQLLRLGERLVVARTRLHPREHEVRRAVHDPEHAMHVRDDERLAQDLDHGDRRAHARLEPQLHAGLGGRAEELRAAAGDQLLVRGHDRLARAEQAQDELPRRVDATHQLRDDGDRGVADDLLEVGREHALGGRERPLEGRVADERAVDAEAVTGRALDVGAAFGQQPVDGGADGAVAEQRHGDVNGGQRLLLPAGAAAAAVAVG